MSGALIAATLVASGSAHAATTITVATTNDTEPLTTAGPCSLRMAVERANGHWNPCAAEVSDPVVINLPARSAQYLIRGSNGRISVTRSVTIQGANSGTNSNATVIGGQEGYRGAFEIPSYVGDGVNLTLRKLRITNFSDTALTIGRMVFDDSPYGQNVYRVTLDTVQIDNCVANSGAAIYNEGGVLTIRNSNFNRNRAAYGGAIYHIKQFDPHGMTLTDTRFTENTADQVSGSGYGGAVYNEGWMQITRSTFANNRVPASYWQGVGGAIYNAGGRVSADQSTFNGNNAGDGGAISNAQGSISMRNCTVSGNTAERSGGGFFNEDYLELFNLTIASNRARSGVGGGVYTATARTRTNSCIIANNHQGASTADDYFGDPHGAANGEDTRSLFGTRTAYLLPIDMVGNPQLSGLASNGGPTQTHAINSGSPAYNADTSTFLKIDQRGVARPRAGRSDLGAYEF